jgi:hypothetical protein
MHSPEKPIEVAEIESLADADFREKPVLVKICVNIFYQKPSRTTSAIKAAPSNNNKKTTATPQTNLQVLVSKTNLGCQQRSPDVSVTRNVQFFI